MRVLGVCGGNGVMLHPLKDRLIANVEIRSAFSTQGNTQWRDNFSDIPLLKALPEVKGVDIIVGHPDCGHSSVLAYSRSKSFGKPKDNPSLTLYIKAVKKYKPKAFFMENLPALIKNYGKSDLKAAFPGYKLVFIQGSVNIWGNSQVSRERLVIVGINKTYSKPNRLKNLLNRELFVDFVPVNTNKLLQGLVMGENGHQREPDNTILTIYAGKKLSALQCKEYWDENKTLTRWKVTDRKFTTAPGVYRNQSKRPPFTVRKGNREFSPEGYMMSPRERARIQGIPDSFIIHFDKSKTPGYWINKGRVTVTKTAPYEIGLWIERVLHKIAV
jgi:site-specific DNA-cytosine methylase